MTESFTPEKIQQLPYRPCVGIMILDSSGRVFVGQRMDRYVEAWQMPQGGVDEGETPVDSVYRELLEETGLQRKHVQLVAQTDEQIPYDLPHDLVRHLWNGAFRGQMQTWFLFRFVGCDDDVDICTQHQEFSAWTWMPLEDVLDNIVPFKRDVYTQVFERFAMHLTSKTP